MTPAPNEIRDELIRDLPDLRAAIRACILFSGQPLKGVAFALGIEVSHLSKMINPSDDPRHFPPNKIDELMTCCGNEIPLRWQLLRRGYASPRQVGELERELTALRLDNEQLRREAKVVFNVFKSVEVPE